MMPDVAPVESDRRASRETRALQTVERNIHSFRGQTIVQPSPSYQGLWARDTMIVALGMLDSGRVEVADRLLRTWATYQIRPDDDPSNYLLLNKHRLSWSEREISRPTSTWLHENRGGLVTSVYIGRAEFPDGTREIYSCHPDPDSTAWWLVACGQYVEITGDMSLISDLGPHLQDALDNLVRRDSDGDLLIEQCPNEDWADHMRRHGKVAYTQAVWYGASRAAQSLGLRGPDPERIRAAVQRILLRQSGPIDWKCPRTRSNRLAQDFSLQIIHGVVDEVEAQRLLGRLDGLEAPYGHRVVAPAFRSSRMGPYHFKRGEYQNAGIWTWLTGWEAQARAQCGQVDTARRLIESCFCPGCDRIYEWVQPQRGHRYNPDFATGAASILSAIARIRESETSPPATSCDRPATPP